MKDETKRRERAQAEDLDAQTDQERFEKDYILETGSVLRTKGRHAIHCLTVVGQIEGHSIAPQTQKTTKYEHVIPQLVSIEEDPEVEGLLVILNTVGGDVEAGLALAELISGITKPSATLVLGGGHSIGIPLAVSARRSFIVPTATMTVHPVRHSGLVLGVPQTMRYFEQMQQRITGFVAGHSHISEARFTELMMHTGELVMDMGSVVDGETAVAEGLIDELGGLGDALHYLYGAIEAQRAGLPLERKRPNRRRICSGRQRIRPGRRRMRLRQNLHSARAGAGQRRGRNKKTQPASKQSV